jgi:hypothetical protein
MTSGAGNYPSFRAYQEKIEGVSVLQPVFSDFRPRGVFVGADPGASAPVHKEWKPKKKAFQIDRGVSCFVKQFRAFTATRAVCNALKSRAFTRMIQVHMWVFSLLAQKHGFDTSTARFVPQRNIHPHGPQELEKRSIGIVV